MTAAWILVGLMCCVALSGAMAMADNAAAGERNTVTAMRGKPVTLVGPELKVGDPAPAFTAIANDMSTFQFNAASAAGKVWIISAVPSVDTPVCSIETRRFNQEAAKLGDNVKILTISMDLPFAQKRWCAAEGVAALQLLSDYRDRAFGKTYGVYIKENGLLARAIFVVGKDGKLVHVQIVPEITTEPNYDAVLQAATQAK